MVYSGCSPVRSRFVNDPYSIERQNVSRVDMTNSGKPFTERLRDRAASREAGGKSRNRAQFLAARTDIDAALAEGWPVRGIWELLAEEGRISFGYAWFAKFVRQHRAPSNSEPPKLAPPAPPSPPPAALFTADAEPPPRPKPARFNHPATPNKEDLI